MDYIAKITKIIKSINEISLSEKKSTGFLIGNTAKVNLEGLYFTPIRITKSMVLGGVIVYSENQAINIIKEIDGKVNYIFVDAEKKVGSEMSVTKENANIERSVREVISKSKLLVYKGNDLSVESIDLLLGYLFKDTLRGLGNKKIAIIGAGNLGSKLSLKLVERGASVFLTRRNVEKLEAITKAINLIKPAYTHAKVEGSTDNLFACHKADILIGATNGIEVISKKIIENLNDNAIIIDAGKGTISKNAFSIAEKRKMTIYRLDISASLSGLVESQLKIENIINKKMGRSSLLNEDIISGGLFARENEIVVDDINNPKIVYGLSNGKGEFFQNLLPEQSKRIEKLKKHLSNLND
jgi:hypothetical protein